MNMLQHYKRDLREKLKKLGTIKSETDTQFSVLVKATPEEAQRNAVALIPSGTDIKVTPQTDGALVEIQFAGVSTLNE